MIEVVEHLVTGHQIDLTISFKKKSCCLINMQNLNTIIPTHFCLDTLRKAAIITATTREGKNKEETKECFISLVSITTNVQVLHELRRRVQFYENMN